jgi:hypothetical protein
MSWAVHLSGYLAPNEIPEVRFEQHSFFVENVCGGDSGCKAEGWYNDTGVVYIDEKHRDLNGAFASSLAVHEFTHYLQDQNMNPCEREREAYHVQNRYLAEALLRIDRIAPGPCLALAFKN